LQKNADEGFHAQAGQAYNLWQIQGIISNGIENEILEPVDNVEELFTQRRHGGGCGGVRLGAPEVDGVVLNR
jgi:hypothetical protein